MLKIILLNNKLILEMMNECYDIIDKKTIDGKNKHIKQEPHEQDDGDFILLTKFE